MASCCELHLSYIIEIKSLPNCECYFYLYKHLHVYFHPLLHSYNLLNPKLTKDIDDKKKACQELLLDTKLEPDKYRMGHTKACFNSQAMIFPSFFGGF